MRPWHCPTSITEKQPPGLATESRCTVSCTPYKMPEEILEWSGNRNVIRPSSTYSISTRRMKRMVSQHQTMEEGMCTMQITISLRGSSRNNQNEGQEDTWWDAKDCRSQSRELVHEGWHVQPSRDRPQGLYAHQETQERAPRGHPLGGGHPKRVPQEFCGTFHSA